MIATLLTAVAPGVIQGLTEFLPVSSSGHLLLFKELFGLQAIPVVYDIILHGATLLVIVGYLRTEITTLLRGAIQGFFSKKQIRNSHESMLLVHIAITSLVTAVIGLGIDRYIPLNNVRIAAYCFLFTALLMVVLLMSNVLLNSRRHHDNKADRPAPSINWKIALILGVAQGVAVLPGISRAGITIIIAQLIGVEKKESFVYSFLIAIPAIVGALVLKLIDTKSLAHITPLALIIGVVSAIVSGYIALRIVDRLNIKNRLALFFPYLILLSIVSFFLSR